MRVAPLLSKSPSILVVDIGDALTMDDGSDEVGDGVGVIPRVIRDLFDGLHERREIWDVKVSCSFFELYNEEINDLFAKVCHAAFRKLLVNLVKIMVDKSESMVGLHLHGTFFLK